MVRVYADEGISATSTKGREEFNAMIEDCKKGLIDMILTKSISRFARNTVDCLNYIRMLKGMNIPVYFEKESINTMDTRGEVLLTIMASLAQQESESLSKNTKMGIHYRFQQGKVMVNARNFLGYDKDESGHLIINSEQAEIVKRIFREYLEGKSCKKIAQDLEHDGILTSRGKAKWHDTSIRKILENEKYMGDALLQKTYTVDFLNKKRGKNNGILPQYYIEHSHEAIIDPQEWDAVQDEFRRRKEIGKAYSGKSVLSCKLICGDCGAYYGSKTWHSNDKYRAIIWQCNSKFDKEKERCRTLHITEQEIKSRFLKVYNGMIEDKESYIIAASEACRVICDTDALDSEINELLREIEVVTEMTRRCISKNAEAAQDQESYTMRYNSLVERYEKAKARYDELNLIRDERLRKGRAIKHYLSDLSGRTELLTEFDDCLWLTTVQSVVVKRDGELLFRFFSGIQVEG